MINDLRQNTKVQTIKIFKMKPAAALFLVISNDSWTANKLNKEVPLKTLVQ